MHDAVLDRILNARRSQARARLILVGALAIAMCVFFLTYDAFGAWAIIGRLRATRLGALVVVAASLSVATAVFQAVTRNRILAPSVMGFDSMFQLVATASVFLFGSAAVNAMPGSVMFLINTALMTALAVSLFLTVLRKGRSNVYLLVLVGIVVGTFLRSVTTLLSTVMDPGEYLVVSDKGTASFAVVNGQALGIAVVVALAALAYVVWRSPVWDILALGPEIAIGLGLNYRREVRLALSASTVLVACATALVGPLMFFGLLVVNVGYYVGRSNKLRDLVGVTAGLGVVVLVGGQALLEHVFDQATVLPVILELVGGLLLLTMIVRGARR
ncbi:iron chelate uptake ABC transporter family permease subunit [Trueperella pecoris]|uniref:Iron chelate uptake ABC transporter family permease subunit n=1 Tax=Trueperella pecoris TaxID=2733571 RepID=A0A7M1R152_9ACTO|nr:iron chelate uptake ABC transporter family permease subunit [Trueperella pecoris]QOR47851.1 iron chelate uptake ABC transporter family permease subunit [Trueperella pecoris]